MGIERQATSPHRGGAPRKSPFGDDGIPGVGAQRRLAAPQLRGGFVVKGNSALGICRPFPRPKWNTHRSALGISMAEVQALRGSRKTLA